MAKKILFAIVPLILSIGIIPAISYDVNAAYIEKFSLPYVLDPLTDSQIKECESIYDDFVSLSDSDFYTRYQNQNFSGNCVMLFEDSLWDYDGPDRYEKLSERSAELTQERETELKQRRENFSITPISVIELQIPGTFLFKFEGCTGDQTIKASDISIVSDKETVPLTKFAGDEREIPPGVCNNLEIQIGAYDPSSIKVVISSLDVEVSAKLDEPTTKSDPIEVSIPNKAVIVRGDLSHKAEPLNDKDMKECENINQDFQKLDENNFNTRYLYHKFVGDCVLLYENPIWETRDSLSIDEINQRLDELKKLKEDSKKDEAFKLFSISPTSIEELSDDLYMYSFEACTGDEFVKVENVVIASDTEVLSLVPQKREGDILPPGICSAFDIKIRAEDSSSIKVVLPMMGAENMLEQKDESKITNKSPRAQVRSGIASAEVVCKEGFELLLKTSDGSPACVKESTASKLIERGWGNLA